jgi:hypothetical protein
LQILHQSELEKLTIVGRFSNDHRYRFETGELRGSPAPLASNDLELSTLSARDDKGLNDSLGRN